MPVKARKGINTKTYNFQMRAKAISLRRVLSLTKISFYFYKCKFLLKNISKFRRNKIIYNWVHINYGIIYYLAQKLILLVFNPPKG